MAGLFKPLHCPSNLYCADSIKEKGPPRRWDGPFLNYGGGSVRLPTLRDRYPKAALDTTPTSCPDTLLQYLMMHWITSFQMFRLKRDSHRFGIFQVKRYRMSCLVRPRHHPPNNDAKWHQIEQRNAEFHTPVGHGQRYPKWRVRPA